MIKFGIVGFGLAATVFHIPLIQLAAAVGKPASISALYSSKSVADIHATLPNTAVFSDINVFMQEADMDVVVIVTPNEFHYDIAKRALLAKKHVVIDKPFVCNYAEGQELIKLAQQQGKQLTVYHNRRWDGDFLTIQALQQQQVFGEIRYFESRFDKYRPTITTRWKEQDAPGTGLLFDIGSHLIDQALTLFGQPDSVSATLLNSRDGAVANDYFDIQLSFNQQRQLARLRGSSYGSNSPFRFYIEGSNASFQKSHLDVQEAQLRAAISQPQQSIKHIADTLGVEPIEHYGRLNLHCSDNLPASANYHAGEQTIATERGRYHSFYDNLIAVLVQERLKAQIDTARLAPQTSSHNETSQSTLSVTAQQALNVIKVIELAQTSAQQGRRVEFSLD